MATATDHRDTTRDSAPSQNSDSLTGLLKELRDETTLLLRQEVALVKQEMAEKTNRLSRNSGYLIAGGLVAYAGAVILLMAIAVGGYVLLLELGLSHMTAGWLAPLIVGGLVTVIGYGLVKKALSAFRHTSVVPERTVESMQNNKQWIKEKVSS